MREPAKMSFRLLRRLADDRDIQAPAEHLSDFAERHPLMERHKSMIADAVNPAAASFARS